MTETQAAQRERESSGETGTAEGHGERGGDKHGVRQTDGGIGSCVYKEGKGRGVAAPIGAGLRGCARPRPFPLLPPQDSRTQVPPLS